MSSSSRFFFWLTLVLMSGSLVSAHLSFTPDPLNCSVPVPTPGPAHPSNQTILCDLCLDAARIAKAGVKAGNQTLHWMEVGVEALCQILGGKVVHAECCLVLDLIQSIFDLIAGGWSPETACQHLHLCPASSLRGTPVPWISTQ